MKIEDVPQDNGMIADYGHEICYAVDTEGKYRLIPSLGWETKNIVNDQAWKEIAMETENIYTQAKIGKLSPLAFYQAKYQMDLGLLAKYVSMAKWRVRRHMKPSVFKKLPNRILQKYASIFGIPISELQTIPSFYSHQQIKNR